MERLEAQQPIFQSTDVLGKEPQHGFVEPSVIGSPSPNQTGQSSLLELGPELVPVDASNLLSGSPLFNDPLRSQISAQPHPVIPGIDPITGLSLTENPSLTDWLTLQAPLIPEVDVNLLLKAETATQATLQSFFTQPDWQQTFQDIFGTAINPDRAEELAAAFAQGDFSALPAIEILSASTLNGASGGFDAQSGKIYLSDALLNWELSNPTLVKSILLEEMGHYIDAQVNRNDTPGDEGEYFADRLQGIDLSYAELLRVKTEDDHATIWLNGSQYLIEQAITLSNFTIRTEGTFTMNGGGDLDGNPINLQDDALVYAAKGFTMNGIATLPVKRDALGFAIRDSFGRPVLVNNAVTVATGYTTSNGPSYAYAGLIPPPVIAPLTINVPLYADLKAQTLTTRVPTGTVESVFNVQQNPLNTAADWATKFPSAGTTTQPKLVRVTNGGLNIPSTVCLKNYVIQVDSGDINFNGTGNIFENVVLIANNGNINLGNVNAKDVAVLASGSINTNGGSRFNGSVLIANGNSAGSINFNGCTTTTSGTDQVQVIAQGSITYNGASHTRGSFLSKGTFIFNGLSTLYGEIGAKGNIIFNGLTTVIGASIRPLNQAPTDFALSPSSVTENVPGTTVVGNFTTTDPDANNTFTYSLVTGTGSTDNTAFSIVGNQLKINTSPDFEAKSSYSIRVSTTDQGGLSYEKALTVSVTDVNETPTNLVLSNSVTPENVIAGSVIGSFTSTDPDANNTFTYSLVTGTGSTDNAAFTIVGNQLKINASPDFEAKSSYSIRVKTTDQGGLSYEKALTISVTDVNEAPTSLVLSNNVTPENVAAGSVIGTLSTTDPDANNSFTYTLVSGTGAIDNAAFTIVGNQLKINTSPDFETKSSYSIVVRTTDQGGLSYDKALTISITDLNEAPTSLVLSNNITPENVAAGSVIGTFASTDPDANNTFTYSLVTGVGSGDNASFSIVGNQLKINASPDFEAKSSYSILVRTTDQGGLSYDKALVIGITDVNEVPTALTLSNDITPENVVAGSVIAVLSTADPDANNTFTYSLVSGTGSTDNAAFTIAANQLKINASPNFEAQSSYGVRVRTTDQGGLSYEQVLTIAITDLNEAPTDLSLSPSSTPENVAPGSTIGNFSTTDPDAKNTFTYSLVTGAGNTDNAAFSVVGNQLTINASPDFEAKSSYSVRVRTTDQGGLSSEKALTVSILNVNEAPTSIALTNASLPENSATGTIIGQLSTVDPDQGDTQQYSLTDSAGDRFEIIGNTLQVKAGAVLDFETTPEFSIEVQSTDAGGLSTSQRFAIALTNQNEAPTLSPLADLSVDEGSLASFSAVATDPDQPSQTLTYSLESALVPGVNLDPTTGLFTWTPTETQGPGSYSFAIKVSDGALSDTKTFSIQVNEVNVAPVLGAISDQQLQLGNTLTLQTTATDADLPANALTYSLDADAPIGSAIDPVTGLLSWTPSTAGDFQFTVRVSDDATSSLFDTKTIRVQVLASNQAPTALALSPATIPENSPANSTIGTLSTTDPDIGNTFTYSLVSGSGSTDNGAFTIIGNQLKINASPDYEAKPSYSIRVKTTDQGALSVEQVLTVAVTNVNEAPVFTSTLTGTATADLPYEYRITTADPENDTRGITAAQLPAWMTFQDNGDGTATLSGTPSFADTGFFTVNLTVTETATTEQLQGLQTVFVGVDALLQEQSNFAPERTIAFTIPTNPAVLSFKIDPLTFDLTDPKSINDAFEVALMDAQGKSLLPTLGTGRDSFFNWTEGFNAASAAGTTYDAVTGIVNVNLTGIKSGTDAQLVFRLVNDDADTTTKVRITDLSLTDAPVGTAAPVVTGTGGVTGLTSAIVEFNHLQDVTPSVEAEYLRSSFNDQTNLLYADVAIKNGGTYAMDVPLIVAVKNISNPSVQLRDPDGFTPEGLPYYDFSALVADGKLDQGEVSNARSLVFYNPNEVQFTYDLVVLAAINQAPVIQSKPSLTIVAGKTYQYDVDATDLNQDTLRYTLVSAPQGMSIDAQTGKINWLPTSNDRGTHSVAVQVSDGRGGIAEQFFTLDVEVNPVNRPPTILSVPVVDANIDTLYSYQVQAEDLDQDTLNFLLVAAPQGMSIDPVTGLIQWTPSINALGKVNVVLKVDDGNGGESVQSFSILTQQKKGKLSPIITSNPTPYGSIGYGYSYDVNAVDPDGDLLTYSLISAPTGVTIDPSSGLIHWTPVTSGSQNIQVQATDNYGGQDVQDFTVNIASTLDLGEIHGNIWEDINGNSLLDSVEKRLPNTKVYLDFNNNQILDLTEPIQFTTALGDYNFTGLSGGRYIVREIVPDGFIQTFPAAQALLGDTLIQNGSFESGPITGYWMPVFQGSTQIPYWNVQLSSVDYCSTGLWQASDGRISIDLDGTPGPGGVSQNITTIPGQVYVVTFDLSAHGFLSRGTTRKMTVSAAGQSAEFTGIAGNTTNMEYQSKQWQFTATSTSTQIAFYSYVGDSYGAVLDNVAVRPVINPSDRAQIVNLAAGQVVENINFGNQRTVVNEANSAPTFFNNLVPDFAQLDKVWKYQARATDLDLDSLAYDLLLGPTGMVVDSSTGLVVWKPTTEQLSQTNSVYLNNGAYNVLLRVQDGKGGVDLQSFEVNLRPDNTAPIFTSTPANTKPQIGKPFQYQAKALDANGDTLSYALLPNAPSGVSINATTGLITWTPTNAQLGSQAFTVKVSDGKGGEDLQLINLTVKQATANRAPVITSTPRTTTRLGNLYRYDIAASDADGDALTYTLQSAPTGMTLQNGVLQWNPTAAQSGDHTIAIQVSDGTLTTTQTYSLTVANQAPNHAPTITSAPALVTNIDRPYIYNLTGADTDGDEIVWSLENAPSGMVIDPQTGALRWQPKSNQLGNQNIVVKLSDSYGLSTTQTFTLKVTGTNTPPTIASAPITSGAINQAYRYSVIATDLEQDALSYSLGQRPQGMTVDATGKVIWTPQSSQLGSHTVEVRVTDSEGATTTQTYTLEVGTTAINHAPEITSTPGLLADLGNPYRYQVQATDPDNNPLIYQLISGPQGMNIDPLTGLTQWQNPVTGTYQVVVGALDNGGLGTAQSFTLTAKANGLPAIQSTPSITATPGVEYKYDLQAKDPEGDKLSYTLDPASQALGMSLDNLGRLRWTPTAAQLGTQPITLTVTDSAGATVTQQFNLAVTADTEAPKVSLIRSVNIADPGDEVFFQALASDNVGIKNLQLLINNTPVQLDGNGVARLTDVQPGSITAKAIATDLAGNQTETTTTIQVLDPTDTDAPQIDLDLSGITDGTITGPVQIKGSVSDTNLDYYVLEVAPLDRSAPFKEVFRGTGNVTNGTLGTFDPSLLQNDSYILRLSAYDTNGQGTTTEQTLSVAGELKLGNFRLSFTDLSIPVTGIPINLTRTYDTLTSNNTDDFGYGWRMEFRDTDLRTNLGKDEQYELFGIRSKGFKEGTRVYITLPGGKREGFTFKPTIDPISRFFPSVAGGDPTLYRPAFVADKGSTSTLSVQNVRMLRTAEGTFAGLSGYFYNPADAIYGSIYTLTTKEGIEYDIDAQTGDLLQVTDTDGNTLTFTDFDVTSSTGQKIVFERDSDNRITSVTDPMGQKVKYAYNDKGDLTAVTDREGNTTQFEYNNTQAHYLDKIIDPLGRTGIKNEYDASGRLKRILDANGNPVEMIYDPNNSIQKVKDALGNETVYEYDNQGNVVTEIDAEGKITKRTYDSNNNVLKETIITTESGPLGWTTTYTYDSNSNQLSRTNALGQTDYYTYDSRSNLLSSTDALGNTTLYTYRPQGGLRSKTDATGHVTTYLYDQWGNVRQRTEGANDITSYEYDGRGNKIKETDALGNVTTFEYDANGNAIKETKTLTTATGVRTLTVLKTYTARGKIKTVINANGNLTQYGYDANGNQTLAIDPLGRRTEMKYNDKNQLIETILPDSTPNDLTNNPRLRYSYDANGNKLTIADQDGDATRYSYNSQKLPTGMVLPDDTPNNPLDNAQLHVEYTQAGWLKTLVKNGIRTEFEHDAVGRITLTRVTRDGQVFETKTTYDAAGNKISETDSLNHTTRYTYDALNRLTSTTYADGTSTSTVYNYAGKPTSITDQAGHTTKYEYDVLDRLTAVVDATNQRTEYKYDEMGHLIEQNDANGHITRYEYDGLGRPTATIRPMGQRSETVYDAVGRVAKTTDFNGDVITYDYDLQNRLIAKNFVSEGRTVAFSYTNDGHRETVTDARGVTRYEYDTQGQLLSRTEPDNTKISYTYDTQNQRVKTVTSLSGTTSYEYNSLAQLTKVTGPEGKATTYTYDAVGNLSTTARPNGTTQTYQYDTLNRLTYLESKDSNRQILASYAYAYTYDKVGNKASVIELGGRKVEYTYDALNRLTKEAITDPVNGNRTIEYIYDVVGNRLSRNDSVEGLTTYTYDNNDRLLAETKAGITTTYAYDRNGNLVSEQSLNKTVVYDWDSENHLVGAITSDATGTHQVQYLYDENGIRVASIRDGVEVRYLVDENRQFAQVIEEYSSTTGTIASYVYGNELVSQTRNSTTSYYLNDGHSGVRQLTDAAGVVTDSYNYDSYGEVIQKTGNTTNDYLYRGEQTDPNTGLQYLRARYYDQNTGRFISTDPFPGLNESPVSKHRYLYANDNPITYSDPSGLFSMGEINAARVALNTLVGGIIQSFAGYTLSKISGEPVQWNGYSISAAKDVKDVSYGGFLFDLTSEKVNGSKTRGFWFVLALGTSFSILPKSFSSDYSGSIGLPDLFGNPPVTVLSPRYFGTKFAAAALSGYFNYLALDSIPGVGIGIGGFTMGFGVGNISWSLGAGFSAGLNTQTGISIPLLPFFDDIK